VIDSDMAAVDAAGAVSMISPVNNAGNDAGIFGTLTSFSNSEGEGSNRSANERQDAQKLRQEGLIPYWPRK
jgi:hypothetical protein